MSYENGLTATPRGGRSNRKWMHEDKQPAQVADEHDPGDERRSKAVDRAPALARARLPRRGPRHLLRVPAPHLRYDGPRAFGRPPILPLLVAATSGRPRRPRGAPRTRPPGSGPAPRAWPAPN